MYKRFTTIAVIGSTLLFANFCSAELSADADTNVSATIAASNNTNQDNTKLSHNPDEIATCLLPGKVRNLGTRMVYIAPRQRVTITRVECDIRGGEVVEG